jgi:hypothetical protein
MVVAFDNKELKLTTYNSVPVDTLRNFLGRIVNNDFTIKYDRFFKDIVIPIDSINAFSWYKSHDSTYVELFQESVNRDGATIYSFELFNSKCNFINIMVAY